MSEGAHSIVERIAEKSEADARAAMETAGRVADREVRSAERQARTREERAAAELAEEARASKAAAAAQASAEMQARQLQKRHEMVETLLSEGLARVAALPRDERYLVILERFIREAVEAMGVREAIVHAPEQDRALLASGGRFERIAAAVRGQKGVTLTLSAETIKAAGGIVAVSMDGRISYHKTFDEIAWRGRSELKNLIATELFG